VRLRWEAAPEAAVYRVFRRRENESWVQLAEQVERSFEDREPPVGNLTYAVRSVDAAGNDSETTTCETVMGHAP
jgi:predicted phage tail protein